MWLIIVTTSSYIRETYNRYHLQALSRHHAQGTLVHFKSQEVTGCSWIRFPPNPNGNMPTRVNNISLSPGNKTGASRLKWRWCWPRIFPHLWYTNGQLQGLIVVSNSSSIPWHYLLNIQWPRKITSQSQHSYRKNLTYNQLSIKFAKQPSSVKQRSNMLLSTQRSILQYEN